MQNMEGVQKSKKFWMIWFSTLDKPRTLKEIHELWNYSEGSNALYKPAGKGHEKNIHKEMIDEGFLKVEKEEQVRGATSQKLYAETDWYFEYIKEKYYEESEDNSVWDSKKEVNESLENKDVRKMLFDFEAFKKLLGSRKEVSQHKDVAVLYALTISYVVIATKKAIPMVNSQLLLTGLQGMTGIGDEFITEEANLNTQSYLQAVFSKREIEEVQEAYDSSVFESEYYLDLSEGVEEQFNAISNILNPKD